MLTKPAPDTHIPGPTAWVMAGLLALFTILQITHAWVVDDAYITLRTVYNFVNGYGLCWNPGERVQSFTHPLWMFLLSAVFFITREAFFSTIALSFCISLLAISTVVNASLLRGAHYRAPLFLTVLLGSKAFLDYSSSGLENPLTHLLIALFYIRFLPEHADDDASDHQLTSLFWLAALAFVNRIDTLVLFTPACIYAGYASRERLGQAWKGVLLASLPAVAWVIFALFYYGTVVPNTAIAKLSGPRLTAVECLRAGVAYVADSAMNDPLSLLACGLAIWIAARSRHPRTVAAAAGITMYLLYVLCAGAVGTHMSGRFFSGVVFLSAVILAYEAPQSQVAWGAGAVVALWMTGSPLSPLRVGFESYGQPRHHVGDEPIIDTRRFAFDDGAALANIVAGESMPRNPWYRAGRQFGKDPQRVHVGGLMVELAIGYSGYAAGPRKHIIDVLGLSDPLISRLPMPLGGSFRPGHFFRLMPQGYVESVEQNKNLITDPDLRAYYEAIRVITRGELFSYDRLRTISSFELGNYDHLLAAYAKRQGLREP